MRDLHNLLWCEAMTELRLLSNFEEFESVTQKELSLIAFGTPWSSPCQIQYKILMNCMRKYRGIMAMAQVDVERHPGIARRANIQTVPTLIVYRKSREIKRLIGLQYDDTLGTIIQAMELSGEKRGVPRMRKFAAWYSRGLPGSAEFRDRVNRQTRVGDFSRVVDEYFDRFSASLVR